ncbi:MAG: 4Fe-4S dicluster domain-containing protein [Elusimicrobia bacterium]|nr:4Fe-4S dicluster domain-containing protein [Elusimicrobiota bacterium]
MRWPITDAFGTKLERERLLKGVAAEFPGGFRLTLDDEGAVLSVRPADRTHPRLEHAWSWLKDRLAGLSVRLSVEDLRPGEPGRLEDDRRIPVLTVALVEVPGEGPELHAAVRVLLERLGFQPSRLERQGPLESAPTGQRLSRGRSGRSASGLDRAPTRSESPGKLEEADVLACVGRAMAGALPVFKLDPGDAVLVGLDSAGALTGPIHAGKGPFFLAWRRPGNGQGMKPGLFIAAALEGRCLQWLAEAGREFPEPALTGFRVLLDGLERGILRRPTVAVDAPKGTDVVVDPHRCRRCGVCADICPAGRLKPGGTSRPGGLKPCLRCFDCVEACPQDALRPAYAFTSAMRGEAACDRPGWLSRLRGCAGPPLPAPFPPTYLRPKAGSPKRPRYILGLAVNTMQEHAAALLKDGRLVGAVEEEKLSRIRHYGWPAPGERRYGFTIEESFCRRSVRLLLSKEGITLDDVDLIAVNGLPPRYGMGYAASAPDVPQGGTTAPLPVIRTGRLMFIPHHLCHAASAFRVSGQKDAWVLTVDGRGERQTAALFRAQGGSLRQVYELLSLVRRSIGGVYESVTRLLGFGAHGQGIVMALAGFGRPGMAFDRYLSWKGPGAMSINEDLGPEIRELERRGAEALKPAHRDLAASLQSALESAALDILQRFVPAKPAGLCLAGGVALNCRMNQLIRERFRPTRMFVQPGANDAGTALGAALEACAMTDPKFKPFVMEDAFLGPQFSEAEVAGVLERSGLSCRRPDDVCREAAELLSRGKVLGWFQGRLEFGPRALGGRSILADPRGPKMKDRVNAVKKRHPWRPFGPSILAGREAEWFEDPFDSRFMLFTVGIRKGKASAIPAVLHEDGTTRPQSVHARSSPLYHRLISEFDRLTGVPMVLNTSFNRKGEPLVCAPQEAVEAFKEMGLDALVIGPFIATNEARAKRRPRKSAAKPAGGRRLSLRLTVECDLDCPHCTIRDLRGLPGRSYEDALAALSAGRGAGCDELVVMRGEGTLWPGLAELCAEARGMGYRFIQLQTHARAFARPQARESLLAAVDGAEVVLLAPDEALHEALCGVPGSFREALMGIKVLLGAGKAVLVTVPVLRRNLGRLEAFAALLKKLGAPRVQFNFPRPVQLARGVVIEPLPRLSDAAEAVRRGARAALGAGLKVSTEGLPLCLLDADLRPGAESAGAWERFRADDLNGLHDGLGSQIQDRPEPRACRRCGLRKKCPRTWPLYLEIFGSGELRPLLDG